MKTCLAPSDKWKKFFSILTRLGLPLVMGIATVAFADPNSPQFNSSYNVRGENFNWVYAYEDGSAHWDYYSSNDGGSLTVGGPLWQSSDGTLSGSNTSGYTGRSIDGYLYQGQILVNENYSIPAGNGWTTTIGGQVADFTGGSYTLTYTPYGSWNSNSNYSYSGPGGSQSESSSADSNGGSSSSVNTTYSSGPDGSSTTSLFGKTLNHASTSGNSQTYSSWDSGTMMGYSSSSSNISTTYQLGSTTITRTQSHNTPTMGDTTYNYSVSGSDPLIGSFSASSTEGMPTTFSRSGPSFSTSSNNIWINSSPIAWTGGTITADGDVSDQYGEGTSISGNIINLLSGQTSSIYVTYNWGGYSGSVSGTPALPIFSVGGLTITSSIGNRWSTSWNVRGETFNWVSASESGGNHTDYYTSAGGGTLSLSGDIYSENASVSGQNSSAYTGQNIAGYYYQSNLLINDSGTYPPNPQLTMTIGGQLATFTGGNYSVTYTNGGAHSYSSSSNNYSGPGGSYSTSSSSDSSTGNSSSETSSSYTNPPDGTTETVFGKTLANVGSSVSYQTYNYYDGWGYSNSSSSGSNTSNYQAGGASFTRASSYSSYSDSWGMNNSSTSSYTITANDPDLGYFTATSPDAMPTAFDCTSPSFARNYHYLSINGSMVYWTPGVINFSGDTTEYYDSGNIAISGNLASFVANKTTGITVSYQGANYPGIVTGTPATPVFAVPNLTIQAQANRWSPKFSVPTLYVNGSPYAFVSGADDYAGHSSDMYSNPSLGTLAIAGSTSGPTSGVVTVSYNGQFYTGTYDGNGTFTAPGISIMTTVLEGAPAGFWVRGRFYGRNGLTNEYQHYSASAPLLLTGVYPNFTLTGSDPTGSFTGAFDGSAGGIFTVSQDSDGAPVAAVPVNENGTMILSAASAPTGFPPAIKIHGQDTIYVFLGTATEDTDPASQAAYYGNASYPQDPNKNHWSLKIRTGGSGIVTYTDYSGVTGVGTGHYSAQSHLFQTQTADALPMPTTAVDANGVLWNPLTAPQGLPATFVLNGQVWRYAGSDSAGDHYLGYFDGQDLLVSAANADGKRSVTLTDPINGNGSGTLNGGRGYADLGDGRIVYSGDYDGGPIPPPVSPGVHSIASDLDITGNVLSLGSRANDISVAGLSLTYSDANNIGSLYSAMNRSTAEWLWGRASDDSPAATKVLMMKLDSNHALNLYEAGNATPTVVLNPGSSFLSKLPNLELTNPPAVGDASANSVLTKGMADGRYLRTDDAAAGYLSQGNAATTYLSKTEAAGLYLTGPAVAATYLSTAAAQTQYLSQSNAATTYLSKTEAAGLYLTSPAVAATYLSTAAAQTQYLSQSNAATTYLSKTEAAGLYLTSPVVAATYLSNTAAQTQYLSQSSAATTYLSKTEAAGLYLTSPVVAATYLSNTAAQAEYLSQSNATATYLSKTEAASTYLETTGLQPALNAERTTSDTRYHRKDQALEITGTVTSNEAAAFHKSVIINGNLDGDGTVRAKAGQEVLVPEQGDISMGEFRSGTQPVVVP